jgi:hypothetical protein
MREHHPFIFSNCISSKDNQRNAMSGPYLKNVALVGASGNLGSKVLKELVEQGKHNITVITRTASTSTFPEGVNVRKGELTDGQFLENAFAGQDIVLVMLAFAGMGDEANIIDAAGRAGVKYLIPSEWGGLSEETKADTELQEKLPLFKHGLNVHKHIENLGMKWIVVTTNSWTDYVSSASNAARIPFV